MCARSVYLPADMADELGRFIMRREYSAFGSVRVKTRNYDVLIMLKILCPLRGGGMVDSDLFASSLFRLQKSFREYLGLCVDCGLVRPKQEGGTRTRYELTDRGWDVVRAFVLPRVET